MKKLAALALSGAVISTAAFAGTESDDFTITANVAEKCVINNAAADIVINYDPFDTTDATDSTSITFNCVKGTSGNISWSSANGGKLKDPANATDELSYDLDVDLNGNVINSGDPFTDNNGIGTGNEETLTFDVTVQAQQNVAVGTYTDTISVNITY